MGGTMGDMDGSVMPRRGFLGTLAAVGVVGPPGPTDLLARTDAPAQTDALTRRDAMDYPRNDLERVQAVVGSSHGNFDRVRSLVLEQPALAKASWDWGFGDWESALGAASHTGRREIAEFLIDHGARPTIFSAAMMGELGTVRAFLEASPDLHRLHGPHGISLMRHARAGGDQAAGVLEYLMDRFGPDEQPFGFPGDAEVEARYGGRYAFDGDAPFGIVVGVGNDWLMFGTGEEPQARLVEVEEDIFCPSGAPAVRFEFDVRDDVATELTIEDGPVRSVGQRVSAG